ncbi:MAG: SDR family NAD(P)-dependent oxidoreductase, partial [Carbonactinosporaceae bacterium]
MTRVAIVTGAGRGIGAAVTRALCRDGWAVVAIDACGDDPAIGYPLAGREDLQATVAGCARPELVRPAVADVRDEASLAGAVRAAVEEFGGVDAAVAAAGVIAGGPPGWEISSEEYATLMGVNAGGVWQLARHALPHMLA